MPCCPMPHAPAGTPRDPQASYRELDYTGHYRGLLALHARPQEAVAELYLFRFWLAHRALAHAGAGTTQPLLPRPCVPQADAGWIEHALGGAWIVDLVESRCDLYDRFFLLGRRPEDPLGLDAATLAIACQLFALPDPAMLAWLRRETRCQFQSLLQAARIAAPPP